MDMTDQAKQSQDNNVFLSCLVVTHVTQLNPSNIMNISVDYHDYKVRTFTIINTGILLNYHVKTYT